MHYLWHSNKYREYTNGPQNWLFIRPSIWLCAAILKCTHFLHQRCCWLHYWLVHLRHGFIRMLGIDISPLNDIFHGSGLGIVCKVCDLALAPRDKMSHTRSLLPFSARSVPRAFHKWHRLLRCTRICQKLQRKFLPLPEQQMLKMFLVKRFVVFQKWKSWSVWRIRIDHRFQPKSASWNHGVSTQSDEQHIWRCIASRIELSG